MPAPKRILVTGATGFLGREIVAAGARQGYHMVAVSRAGTAITGSNEQQACGDLARGPSSIQLAGVDAVIHCAALVHQPTAPTAAYTAMNVDLPFALAKAAREAGTQIFVQISSVAAIASQTAPGTVLDDSATPHPSTPYGASKLAADEALRDLVTPEFGIVSLRPPAIYGPDVGAPFAQLMTAARMGLPVPLGSIRSLRSFAYVSNIADAALCVAATKQALVQSGSFIVTDSLPITPASFYSSLTWKHGHKGRVWNVPGSLVEPLARLVLRGRANSLLTSAAFNGARFMQTFNWRPDLSIEAALENWVSEEPRHIE